MSKPGRRSRPCAKCNRVARLRPTRVGAVCKHCWDLLSPEDRDDVRAGNLQPFDDPSWALLHDYFLASLDDYEPVFARQIILDEIGTSFEAFYEACAEELIVISPHLVDNEVWYGIAIRFTDNDVGLLAAIHHSLLNIDDETLAIERKLAAQYGNVSATEGGASRN